MKRWMIVYSLFCILVGIPYFATVQAADKSNGKEERYQLFNAEYNSSSIQRSQTTVFLEKRLFKIDTLTGDTWMLIDVLRDGRDIKYWKKIENVNRGKDQ